jgi:acetolactate synthase-1/2/3 large subunit
MTAAEFIFKFIADKGVGHVFLVTGGGAMYLNEALGRQKGLQYICNLHEQACAMAAEGYARISNLPGVINVTTGPGGTNAITGVLGAWLDSIPLVVISGQVKRETLISRCPDLKLRQLGDQEADIVACVKSVTKYAVTVTNKEDIRFHLEHAWHLAISGRPGPVWIDVPLDIQAADIGNPEELRPFIPETVAVPEDFEENVRKVYALLSTAERPVIVAGNGVRLAGVVPEFRDLVAKLKVPVLTAISGVDLIPSDHPYFFGRPGMLGERPANFIMQNADLVLILGTRMSLRVLSYAYDTFARGAYTIMVDADPAELAKPTLKINLPLCCDAGDFLMALAGQVQSPWNEKAEWLRYCRRLKDRYPVVTDEHRTRTDYVSSYALAEMISHSLTGDEIIVTGNGIAYTSTFQAIKLKPNQRMFANVGCASMGYDLPAAIGAAFAGGGREVICMAGDGSIQMNIQELQTLVNYKLPIKIFMLNNDGYLSIKLTQNAFFKGHFVGSHPGSGVILPDMQKVAKAYGLPSYRVTNHAELASALPEILNAKGPVFCEVICDPFESVGPKSASRRLPDGSMVSSPLEDLFPYLDREEFKANMIIPCVE